MIVISVIWFLSANERSEDTRLVSVIFSALKLIAFDKKKENRAFLKPSAKKIICSCMNVNNDF